MQVQARDAEYTAPACPLVYAGAVNGGPTDDLTGEPGAYRRGRRCPPEYQSSTGASGSAAAVLNRPSSPRGNLALAERYPVAGADGSGSTLFGGELPNGATLIAQRFTRVVHNNERTWNNFPVLSHHKSRTVRSAASPSVRDTS